MLAQIRNQRRKFFVALLAYFGACFLISCAHDEHVALVKDPDDKHDSQIPWDKQEKWETQSELGGITDRR